MPRNASGGKVKNHLKYKTGVVKIKLKKKSYIKKSCHNLYILSKLNIHTYT